MRELKEISSELEQVEKLILKSVYSRNRLISEAAGEIIASGGKRLRPALVILSSMFGEYDEKKVTAAAGAIEVLHTATLVHDDIIDKSATRRGRPTVSRKYGEDMAVYVGDYLFTRAILLLSGNLPVSELENIAKAVKIICEGEVDQYLDKFNIDISIMSYLKKSFRKTAILFSIACVLGAQVSGCSPQIRRALGRFGANYGMAFQIRDDINDLVSDEKKLGKPAGSDIVRGIMTLPVIYAISKSLSLKQKIESLKGLNKEVTAVDREILQIIEEKGGIKASYGLLEKYVAKGRKLLRSLPDGKSKDILDSLICGLL